jgi:ribosomal protection tetracycline resistance protein
LLRSIFEKLAPTMFPMGSVSKLGTRGALYAPYGPTDAAFTSRLVDLLADHDDAFMAAYVDHETAVSYSRLCNELAAQTKQALVHPVFFGSAVTGAGVDALFAGIKELLPATEGDADGPVSGSVFKIERGPVGEKIAYVRMFSGTIRTRDRLPFGQNNEGKVTAISVFERGSAVGRASVAAGQIGKSGSATRLAYHERPRSVATSPRQPWKPLSFPAALPTKVPCTLHLPSSPSRTH